MIEVGGAASQDPSADKSGAADFVPTAPEIISGPSEEPLPRDGSRGWFSPSHEECYRAPKTMMQVN